jgi:hypothetical protein
MGSFKTSAREIERASAQAKKMAASGALSSMVGRCPWGVPLMGWSQPQLRRGLAEVNANFFPRLVKSITAEMNRRGMSSTPMQDKREEFEIPYVEAT